MKNINEITIFAYGDSRKLNVWSNVPYFLTETLMSKGIKINRVDISAPELIEKIYRRTCFKFLQLFNKNTTYEFHRTLIYYFLTKCKIKQAVKRFPDSDANIFLTFSISASGLTNKPNVLFSDWTYDHLFNYFKNSKPDFLEAACVNRENSAIEKAEVVLPLFPGVADYMKSRYKNKNIFYLGNVINSMLQIKESEINEIKSASNNLLFVGSKKYIEGAVCLTNAFKLLKQELPRLKLNIIGMSENDLDDLPEDVFCHGYLDKGNDKDRETYYTLFKSAKIFINTTPKWGAFSATVEAMYFYTPVIVTPYDEFVKTFGNEIEFGSYCSKNEPGLLREKIKGILNSSYYNALAANARNSVKDFTWNSYTDKILEKISDVL